MITPLLDHSRIVSCDPVPTPADLRLNVPASDAARSTVGRARTAASDIVAGRDDRLLVVVGPCSVHDPRAAMDYAARLAEQSRRHRDRLQVVMRVYFEKPRTTLGWKGLLNDPHLDGSHDIATGLLTGRMLLRDIAQLGLATAGEFLDPASSEYLADLVGYGAIGARTAASQVHRQMVSGLPMPVGIKNSTDGDVQVAVDGVVSAASAHRFLGTDPSGRLASVGTIGNPDAHVILRGGSTGPNYDAASVADTVARLGRAGLPQRVVIDASHGNSAKNHLRQRDVLRNIAARVAMGEDGIAGVMAESFLVEGRQDLGAGPLTYGQSITDACLGWDSTVELLDVLSSAVSARRAA
ncbi:phospho-2-dehydro-3-deoxyheptonate aldolase [Rhodococcoides trifolii]|uniref:Phospho-2-dehydro-3-deoxyheptonate aldolase n=1 Tax=Rhodococcoides trifolii TaxID=908250 RepID=A0A917G4J8_9NOCA|nr:3-deoxy-7-phosphoheptulonate synthase [Rhodococcus trifolii]GGG22637.1 phospho-2-dehydro-3-deoxyheptonate aldolase [Rhodococcus trifolii]